MGTRDVRASTGFTTIACRVGGKGFKALVTRLIVSI